MQPGTLVAGKYRVERVIGRGGMGVVVEATHLTLATKVALKFLNEEMASDPSALARFRREAQASAQLKSEHICRVSDFGLEGKVPYIVMELLKGTDLAKLTKVRNLDVPTAALYIQQACIGLAEAHAARIIHRDLKPGNLFLTRRADGSPLIKVLDFGVAKAEVGENEVGLTSTSNVVGSPGFMSPEQFRSSKTVDGRADIWALGIVLYKLISGRLPFKPDVFAEFVLAISREQPPPLSEAPPTFEAIVMRCLAKDPAQRYRDVTALGVDLAPFAALARKSTRMYDDDGPLETPTIEKAPAARATPPPARTLVGLLPNTVELQPSAAESIKSLPTVAGTAVGVAVPRTLTGDLVAGTVVGEYRIEKKIGQGGMGVVYSAVHPLIGKKAAIKVIGADVGTDPIVVQRFIQEARSVNQIGHPNIVDVFAFGQLPDGRNYFVMEHLQGESLRGRLTRAFIPLADGIQILDEIAGALEAAHEQQIVHRDLKPDNVFLSSMRGGMIIVKLLDFGIAKLVDGRGIGVGKTSTGQLMGTPAYLSPEQARGRNVDYRTDIYALGCMMFEVVTGRMPFMAESAMDIVLMHLSMAPRRPSELVPNLPPTLEQLILQMLDKDPANRPSLAQVRDVFAELFASGMVQIEPGTGATFRSELARGRRDSELRTPQSSTHNQILTPPPLNHGPGSPPTTARVQSDPGSIATPPKKSHRGLWIALVVAALCVPITTTIIAVTRKKHATATAPSDAAIAIGTAPPSSDAAAGPASATTLSDAANATAPPSPDAAADTDSASPDAAIASSPAVATTRDVQVRVNVPIARISVDGADIKTSNGAATVALADGAHTIEVTSPGRVPLTTQVEVSATRTTFELAMVKSKPTTTTTTKDKPPKDKSRTDPPKGDYTINPF